MRTSKRLLGGIVILWSTVWCAPVCAQPFFMGLGDLRANGVSDDGSVVVGTSNSARTQAFRWTQDSGMVGLGYLPGQTFSSRANGVSADGSVVVGGSSSTASPGSGPPSSYAFRWTQTGGLISLDDLPGSSLAGSRNPASSYAFAVSADGSVVVGHGNSNRGYEASRWTESGGIVGLGDLPGGIYFSRAYGVSADGSVIVGYGSSASGYQAFRWRQSSGMVALGELPGGEFSSIAYDVSADGSVVVGQSSSASGAEAFRWTQGAGMVGLGFLPGVGSSSANAVSDDGSVIVGMSGNEAFLWSTSRGMRNLREVLFNEFSLGAALAGWTLTSANDISADGQIIVGAGTNPNGNSEAWIAHLAIEFSPTGDYNGNGVVDAADYTVWQDTLGQTGAGLAADGSGNGIVDAADYNLWKTNFGATAGSGAASVTTADSLADVPEPACLVLMTIAAALTIKARRTRRKRPRFT